MGDSRGAWGPISDAMLGAIQSQAQKIYSTNPAVKALLTERSKRLADLAVKFIAASEEERAEIRRSMDLVRQTLANDMAALAVDASAEMKASLGMVADAVFQTVTKILPGIASIL